MHNHTRYATQIAARTQSVKRILANVATSYNAQELRKIAMFMREHGRRVPASDYKAAAQYLERMGP